MLLVAESLTRRYGRGKTGVTALADASFAIGPGEYVAIMGPSGSGKSTLMNLIGLLDRPSAGRLVVRGEDVTNLSPDRLAAIRNRDIGFVFQSYNLLARHTALENVEVPLVYAGVRRKERVRRAHAALAAVGLAERSGHRPGETLRPARYWQTKDASNTYHCRPPALARRAWMTSQCKPRLKFILRFWCRPAEVFRDFNEFSRGSRRPDVTAVARSTGPGNADRSSSVQAAGGASSPRVRTVSSSRRR